MGDHYQRWQPDTCDGFEQGQGCSFIQVFDDAETDPDKIKPKHDKTEKKCKKHTLLSDRAAYDVVVDENTRKNKAWAVLKQFDPSLAEADYLWSIDKNSLLTILIPDHLTKLASLSADIQSFCDEEFGPDKVMIRRTI